MKIKNSFLSSSIIYVFGSFLTSGLAFITTPIFTRLLTPEDYGITSVFATWVSVFTIFVGVQTSSTIATAHIHFKKEEFNQYLSSILFLSTVSFAIVGLICFVFKYQIASLLNLSIGLLIVLILQSFLGYVQQFYNTYLIQTKKPLQSLILSVSYSFLTIGLSLLLIFKMDTDRYYGKILGNAIIACLFGLCLYFVIMAKGKKLISLRYWKYCLPLGLPIILHLLSGLVLGQSDRVMLQSMSGNYEAGIYSFAYTIASVLSLLWSATNNAWVPWYFDNTKAQNTKGINQLAKKYILLFSLGTCAIMLMTPEVMKILGPEEYWSAGRVIAMVVFGIYFNFLYTFAVNYEFYCQNTRWIAVGSICAAAVNVGLNLLLIPQFGGVGAAIATLISYFALFVFHNIIAIRLGGFNISKRLYIYGIGIVILGFFLISIFFNYFILRIIIFILMLFYMFYYKCRK
ncbi:lipopolysaccharide biosynthesis protein [Eubacterium callanderi]|uniref:lipopolysaccharide biosynthesis protein n=1 Tax=Eubacterium callanderi TaxID=53442 RepID=UPI00399B60BA